MLNLLDYSLEEFEEFLKKNREKPFRARQIWKWIWEKECDDFFKMTDISKQLRVFLSRYFTLKRPEVLTIKRSSDKTAKFLLKLKDGHLIETVLIPEEDHYTLCASSQVGCPMECKFCSTGKMGFERNLSSGEILSQVLIARQYLKDTKESLPLRNIVFMGMGEPLLNWIQVKKALRVITDRNALGFSKRRTTISTVGFPEILRDFVESDLGSLAISLHAPNQKLREALMPKAAKACSLEELLSCLKELPIKSRQRITVEYILIDNVNDSILHARELCKILSHIRCKVNLIAYNPVEDIPFKSPSEEKILEFENFLKSKNFTVTLRKSKGRDISAACGQLKASMLTEIAGDERCLNQTFQKETV